MIDRYHRHTLLPFVGPTGQTKLASARIVLIGCGALGCVIADQLARAGVGRLRLIDRDVVETTNLQRQILFDESDAQQALPKSIAAASRLSRINSSITIEPIIADVHSGNIENLIEGFQIILDGTDNAQTRYLINDAAVKNNIPWVYGSCVASEGRTMAIIPNHGPCLRCVFSIPPAAGELPTCDTAGVLGAASSMIASMQVTTAIQIILGQYHPRLISIDLWNWKFREIESPQRNENCVCCGEKNFEFLNRTVEQSTAQLCGRGAIQIHSQNNTKCDLGKLAARLQVAGQVEQTRFLVRCQLKHEKNVSLTIFPDGRTIVQGTEDLARARSLVARYVGE